MCAFKALKLVPPRCCAQLHSVLPPVRLFLENLLIRVELSLLRFHLNPHELPFNTHMMSGAPGVPSHCTLPVHLCEAVEVAFLMQLSEPRVFVARSALRDAET